MEGSESVNAGFNGRSTSVSTSSALIDVNTVFSIDSFIASRAKARERSDVVHAVFDGWSARMRSISTFINVNAIK